MLALTTLLITQSSNAPIERAFEELDGDAAISVTINGKIQKCTLMPYWTDSFIASPGKGLSKINADGRTIAASPFYAPKEKLGEGIEGALGLHTLRQFAVGFDLLEEKVQLLPGGNLTQSMVDKYFSSLTPFSDKSRYTRIPMVTLPDGTPGIELSVGALKLSCNVQFTARGSWLLPNDALPKGVFDADNDDQSLLGASFAGLSPRWFTYFPDDTWLEEEDKPFTHGILALDAFQSRRILFDFRSNVVYVEDLPDAAKQILFLRMNAGLPLFIKGDAMTFDILPGETYDYPTIPAGSTVLSLAGYPALDWIKDLRLANAEAITRTAQRIAAVRTDFDVQVRKPNGEVVTVPIKVNDEGLRASAQAGAPARAGSPSP